MPRLISVFFPEIYMEYVIPKRKNWKWIIYTIMPNIQYQYPLVNVENGTEIISFKKGCFFCKSNISYRNRRKNYMKGICISVILKIFYFVWWPDCLLLTKGSLIFFSVFSGPRFLYFLIKFFEYFIVPYWFPYPPDSYRKRLYFFVNFFKLKNTKFK